MQCVTDIWSMNLWYKAADPASLHMLPCFNIHLSWWTLRLINPLCGTPSSSLPEGFISQLEKCTTEVTALLEEVFHHGNFCWIHRLINLLCGRTGCDMTSSWGSGGPGRWQKCTLYIMQHKVNWNTKERQLTLAMLGETSVTPIVDVVTTFEGLMV